MSKAKSAHRPLMVGLTGSIGMGKSTVAAMFAQGGAAVWDADGAVHRLYKKEGAANGPLVAGFGVKILADDGDIDREKLAAEVLGQPDQLKKLEAIIHPLVGADRADFIGAQMEKGAEIIILDIPLIFETGAEDQFDLIVVASAPINVQRQRVLARPNMSEAKFEAILARQVPDEIKRQKADIVIDTSQDLDQVRQKVSALMAKWKNSAKTPNTDT